MSDGQGPAAPPRGTGDAPPAYPAVDVLTEAAAVVLQERPVVPLSPWLADAAAMCAARSLHLHVVTPPHSRLTPPLHHLLDSSGARWVVRHLGGEPGYQDGITGQPLGWDGATFAPGADPASPPPPDTTTGLTGSTTLLEVTAQHPATERTQLGGVAEVCFEALTGSPPAGWGVAEPATQHWDRHELTRLCRERAPRPTALVLVGGTPDQAAVATLTATRVTSGVHEQLRLAVGAGEPPAAALKQLAERLLQDHPVRMLLVGTRPGPSDGTLAAGATFRTVPHGLLIGADAVAERGAEHARGAPAPHVLLVGSPTRPGCWIPMGSRADPAATLTRVLLHFAQADLTASGEATS